MQKEISVDLTLSGIKKDNTQTLHNILIETTNFLESTYKSYTYVYTDASKNLQGNMGIAIKVPSINLAISFRLSDKLTVYTGELFAIFKAIEIIKIFNINRPLILTDSKSALEDIQKINSTLRPNLIYKTRSIITILNLTINFCYIPSHIGHVPHDEVDLLAKVSSNFTSVTLPILLEIQESYIIIDNIYMDEWKKSYKDCTTGLIYLKKFPTYNP